MSGRTERVAIIGLDCVPPEFLFGDWLERMPNVRLLIERGVHGELESVTPPITVPAWMSMMTSRDPGSLGVYGFRNRRNRSYDGLEFASSRSIKEPPLWDALGMEGKRSLVIGVPPTYPPKPINGNMIACFLTPDTDRTFTFPSSLGAEVNRVADGYVVDARDFRESPKDDLLAQLYAMMEKRFETARHLVRTKPWELFVMVEMAPDRLHHAFWRYVDPSHRLYEPANPYENVMREFYKAMDAQVGELLDALGDETTVFVVSDHGAKRMDGGVCLNEWLIREGYLTLKDAPSAPTKFDVEMVDWSKTRAWGDGGYYGRIFLNLSGREPQGIVPNDEADRLKSEIVSGLESLGDDHGKPIGSRVHRPEDIYAKVNGVAPDLIAIFGDLHWRSIGQVGTGDIHTFENDTGPDDANHAQQGVIVASGPGIEPQRLPTTGMSLLDIAPTVLDLFGVEKPTGAQGASLIEGSDGAAFTEEDEEKIARRLEDLGYL